MSSPIEFRSGATGAGAFVGCGVGAGFIAPISLHSIPVLSQIASSASQAMYKLDSITNPILAIIKRGGGDVGAGCGVLVGYGWGFGFMLTPTAAKDVSARFTSLLQGVKSRIPGLDRLEMTRNAGEQRIVGIEATKDSIAETTTAPIQQQQLQIDTITKEVSELSQLMKQQHEEMNMLQRQVANLQNIVLEDSMQQNKNKKR